MDETGSILIDRNTRRALAAFLLDQEISRPYTISKQAWRMLLHAELAEIPYDLLGEMLDTISPAILDVIMWPDASNWRFPTGPSGVPI